jgi:opacity protein-like surface antigen
MRRFACAIGIALLLAVPAFAAEKPEDAAQAAAESWLKLVDQGQYGASWDQAAKLFKGAVTKEKWIEAARGVREPLGKLVSRKVTSRAITEKVPGGPDGAYVVIRFETVFEKKSAAVETVTPMRDPDGAFRVSGYYIR